MAVLILRLGWVLLLMGGIGLNVINWKTLINLHMEGAVWQETMKGMKKQTKNLL